MPGRHSATSTPAASLRRRGRSTSWRAGGLVRGYDDGSGRFGPTDPLLRAQAAALDVRALGWLGERGGANFADRDGVDDELWAAVGVLAAADIARGFGDGTFGPTAPITAGQWVALLARAMVAKGLRRIQPDTGCAADLPAVGRDREDVATFCRYLPGLAGEVRGGEYAAPAERRGVALLLWQVVAWLEAPGAGDGERPQEHGQEALDRSLLLPMIHRPTRLDLLSLGPTHMVDACAGTASR